MTKLTKLSLLGGLLAIAGVSGLGQSALAGYESLEAAQKAAREMNKPLLIDFYTEW